MTDFFKIIVNLKSTEIITYLTLLVGFFSMLNEKFRGFVLRKLTFKNNEAKLKNEGIVYDDNSLEVMLKRINALNNDFVLISDKYIEAIKDANKFKYLFEKSEQTIKEIKLKCNNDCLQ